MSVFTIKDLENLSGIKAHTIRVWEQRYSFLKPQRSDTNIRYYSNDELQVLLNVALLNRYGCKISHIDKMSVQEMNEKILGLNVPQAQKDRLVNTLIHCMADLRMEEFEAEVEAYINECGIEKAITQVLFPFLERIGILWLTNHIHPAQEHLVSNIIRQKIIVGIDRAKTPYRSSKTALLFLPEGEYHEMGLLFVHYLLRVRGIRVLYLGANIPAKDVASVAATKNPDFLYAHLTSGSQKFNVDKFLLNIHHRMPDKALVLSGAMTGPLSKKKLPPTVTLKTSLADVLEFVSGL